MTTQPFPALPPGFDELSKEEQIEYVQALWNRISADVADVPIPDGHLQLIRERLATIDEAETVSWESIKSRLKNRHDG